MHRYNVTLSDEYNDYLIKIGSIMSVEDGVMWSISDCISFCVLELMSQDFISRISNGDVHAKRS